MSGRVALVTGGIGGIGTSICQSLARAGYRVVGTYIAQEQGLLAEWQAERQAENLSVEMFELDVTSFDNCKQVAAEIQQKVGPIEILVNNAGITRDTVLKKMDVDKWRAVLSTNLDGVFNMTRQVVEGMLERGFGRVINISSVNGQKGQFGQTNYSAAKAGMHGFTMALAQEVARNGVTVNSISPGYTGTKMVMAIDEAIRNQIIAQVPVKRLAKPEEIARVVVFLADDESGYITGANIPINGGLYMS